MISDDFYIFKNKQPFKKTKKYLMVDKMKVLCYDRLPFCFPEKM